MMYGKVRGYNCRGGQWIKYGKKFTSVRNSKAVVGLLGILEDRNSSFLRGPAKAPPILRESLMSNAFNTWSELDIDVSTSIKDFGDISPISNSHKSMMFDINLVLEKLRQENLLPLTLGGDHSITFPLCLVLRQQIKEPLVIVHFDAHPDIYHDFEGNPDSHASPFARICETKDLCRQLISIGVRTITGHQRQQIEKFKVKVIEAKDFPYRGADVATLYLDKYISTDSPVYVSVDMDVLEPGLAPGVSHREAGGLTTRQLIDAIHAIPGRIIGADLVEFNPNRDIDGITAAVGGKLLKELAGKMIRCHLDEQW